MRRYCERNCKEMLKMRFRLFLPFSLAFLMFTFAKSGLAETIPPAGQERQIPFAIGAGLSNFDIDYGQDHGKQRRMAGITGWFDWSPPDPKGFFRGISMEVEGRNLNYGHPSSLPQMHQYTFAGGALYSWRPNHPVYPYAKYLLGMGNINSPSNHTNLILAPGAGLACRVFKNVWVRGDYEYQFWPNFYGRPHALNPNGFTISTAYDFRTRPRF
jgi:hypothetical protein